MFFFVLWNVCVIVLLCFFLPIVFFVMQLLSNSSICKLICTLNCSVECSLDHSLGCNLEYSLGCSLGCNLDCNHDRFLNYNVDCNEICNMQKVMQRNKNISQEKNENQLLRFSIEHTWCSTWRCMCQILLHFFCVAECVVLFCFVFCFRQSHFFGYAIVKA